MKRKDRDILCSLVRDHEDAVGASRLTMIALKSFIESIKEVKCSVEASKSLYLELSAALKNTKPKIIPLIHLIEEFEKEMGDNFDGTVEEVKGKAISILEKKYDKLKTKVGKVIEYGLTCINEGDVVVVHTVSYDLRQMLIFAKEVFQKNFKVIVLKQDFKKTKKLIKDLSKAKVEIMVIPEYSLGHYIEQADKLFIGALSITDDMKVVSAVGTANVVGMCHLNDLPVYLFATSLKFSHHTSSQQKIHRKVETLTHDDFSYCLTTHSHDMLKLKHVDFLVTEEGIKDKKEIETFIRKSRC